MILNNIDMFLFRVAFGKSGSHIGKAVYGGELVKFDNQDALLAPASA